MIRNVLSSQCWKLNAIFVAYGFISLSQAIFDSVLQIQPFLQIVAIKRFIHSWSLPHTADLQSKSVSKVRVCFILSYWLYWRDPRGIALYFLFKSACVLKLRFQVKTIYNHLDFQWYLINKLLRLPNTVLVSSKVIQIRHRIRVYNLLMLFSSY